MLQYAQASLRDMVGSMSLDELLSERDQIQSKIATAVESRSAAWGIHVDSLRLLDINMPEELKRMMSRQASADREKRATIIKAEGDKEAAKNLAQAAETMTARARCSCERCKRSTVWARARRTRWCSRCRLRSSSSQRPVKT